MSEVSIEFVDFTAFYVGQVHKDPAAVREEVRPL